MNPKEAVTRTADIREVSRVGSIGCGLPLLCVCVCVCMWAEKQAKEERNRHMEIKHQQMYQGDAFRKRHGDGETQR